MKIVVAHLIPVNLLLLGGGDDQAMANYPAY
jgi:hypothetical protein